jgi:outer membrane protein
MVCMDEQRLVKLYMELTGATEPVARNVFMMLCSPNNDNSAKDEPNASQPNGNGNGNGNDSVHGTQSKPRFNPAIGCWLIPLAFWCLAAAAQAAPLSTNQAPTSQPFGGPLSLADALNLALRQSPAILRAQKELEASRGIVIQTRAIALPTLGIGGNYGAVQRTDIDVFEAPGFTFGTPQNWSSQVKLIQSLYQGGRLLSAFRAADLTRQQSLLNYQTAVADTVLTVQLAYYDVLLAAQQITVQEASVDLLTNELRDTTRRFDAGTVPRFNVLRAEVELANARPKLINARNGFRISKNNLSNLLGLTIPPGTFEDIPLILSGKLEAEAFDVELPRAISQALEKRTELGSLRKTEGLRKEDLVTARAGYKPVLQGYVGYDVHNSMLSSDLTVTDHGWIAGVQLSWNLFDGLRTQGRIREAMANYERAGIDLDDRARTVELEVRTAYSNFIEAREVLDSERKVVEEAEEALRLARARSDAGTGTQLDVLSAQTALTEARTTQIQALHDYEAARARLQRAIGMNVPTEAQ